VARSFIIYCDESVEKGEFFSHFYGGALVRAEDREKLEAELTAKKTALNMMGEVKWTKITWNYAEKYVELVDTIFDMIRDGRIKVRIMFTQNINVRPDLPEEKIDNEYFMLYYQFIKHAFGLRYWGLDGQNEDAGVSILIDDPPQSAEKFDKFKSYMASLSDYPVFSRSRIRIRYEDIAAIDSKSHNLLQALDIILGGIQSRLNEVHTRVDPPAKRRSKRARAKELVYAKIKERIWEIYPRFNVGANTGQTTDSDRWFHPYRHWLFVPTGSVPDRSRGKKK